MAKVSTQYPIPGGGYVGITIDDTDLRELPRRYRAAARPNLVAAMSKALKLAQRVIIPKLSEYTGDSLREIVSPDHTKILPGATLSPLQGVTGVMGGNLVQLNVAEEGRRPGLRPPPSDVMERWAQQVIGEKHLGFIIARSIGRKGIKAKHPFSETAKEIHLPVQALFEAAVNKTIAEVNSK